MSSFLIFDCDSKSIQEMTLMDEIYWEIAFYFVAVSGSVTDV